MKPRRRRHVRYPVEESRVTLASHDTSSLNGWVTDASEGGIGVELTQKGDLKEGEVVKVTWQVPPDLDPNHDARICTVEGTVVRQITTPQTLSRIQGIRFHHTLTEVHQRARLSIRWSLAGLLLLTLAAAVYWLTKIDVMEYLGY